MFNNANTLAAWSNDASTSQHLVIGAGFAGLCAAIKLAGGRRDATSSSIEKGSDVGGTWRDNTYPGAACDVPSQLYSFSFAPNPDWSSSFSPQPEIQAYLQQVAAAVRASSTGSSSTPPSSDAAWDDDGPALAWSDRRTDGERRSPRPR